MKPRQQTRRGPTETTNQTLGEVSDNGCEDRRRRTCNPSETRLEEAASCFTSTLIVSRGDPTFAEWGADGSNLGHRLVA